MLAKIQIISLENDNLTKAINIEEIPLEQLHILQKEQYQIN